MKHAAWLPALVLVLAGCPKGRGSTPDRDPRAPTPRAQSSSAPDASSDAGADASAPDVTASPPDAGLPPLGAPSYFDHMTFADGTEAFYTVPLGATEPRPILGGVHGAGDRADWSCSEWHATTGGFPFVVCPRGVPAGGGFHSWGSVEQIATRADRAVARIRELFGKHVAEGPLVYGGWSQGGTLAAHVLASRPDVYAAAVLVEVGHTALSAEAVLALSKRGGVARILVACSSGPCVTFSRDIMRRSPRAGVRVDEAFAGMRGHWFDEPMFRAIDAKLPWLVEGDARWTGLGGAIEARHRAAE